MAKKPNIIRKRRGVYHPVLRTRVDVLEVGNPHWNARLWEIYREGGADAALTAIRKVVPLALRVDVGTARPWTILAKAR